MLDASIGVATVAAERRLASTQVQLLRIELRAPTEHILCDESSVRLDLSLSPRRRGTRVRFNDRWIPGRFEAPGKLFLVPPGETLRVRSTIGSQRSIVCRLMLEPLQEVLANRSKWPAAWLDASLDIPSSHMQNLLVRLAEELTRPGLASDVMIETLALQVAVEMQRYFTGLDEQPRAGALASWRLRLIDERLNAELAPPSLEELAILCRLSARQLSRCFIVSRGISLGRYIAEHRLTRAKQLLRSGESVKSVSIALGFSSPASFCQAFHNMVGSSPGQFRQTSRST